MLTFRQKGKGLYSIQQSVVKLHESFPIKALKAWLMGRVLQYSLINFKVKLITKVYIKLKYP